VVRAALPVALAGCAASEVAPPHPPPPPPPAAPAAVRQQPEAPAGLGPLALALPAATTRPRALFFQTTTERFGDATFLHGDYSWTRTSPPCPIALPRADASAAASPADPEFAAPCALFSLARGPSQPWSTPRAAPARWISFAPGRSVLYALRAGKHVTIDAIAADGQTSLWLDDPTPHDWSEIRVLESPAGDRIIGVEESVLVTGRVVAEGARRTLAGLTPLTIESADIRPNANQARRVVADSHTPLWGRWSAAMVDPAKDSWALAFTEVIPPPPTAPEGQPFRPKGRAKHDCGGKMSRSLADASVSKRLHVMRFQGSQKTADAAEDLPVTHDASKVRLELAVAGPRVGVWLDGVAHGDRDVPAPAPRPAPPPSPLPTTFPEPEETRGLAFDRASGEGIVLIARGDEESYGRLFDAAGAFTSEPFPLPDGVASQDPQHLARLRSGWLTHDVTGEQIVWLTGSHAGQTRPAPKGSRDALLIPTDETHAALLWRVRSEKQLQRVDIDGEQATIEPGTTPIKEQGLLGSFRRESDGVPVLIGSTLDLFNLQTGDTIATSAPRPTGYMQVVHAWDGVAVITQTSSAKFSSWWVSPDRIELLPASLNNREVLGPLIGSNHALPGSPGPLVTTPAYDDTLCPHSVATGPRRFVLACAEGMSTPAVRVGLRAMTVDLPPRPPEEKEADAPAKAP
jgi:hypothetical protein